MKETKTTVTIEKGRNQKPQKHSGTNLDTRKMVEQIAQQQGITIHEMRDF